MSAMIIDGKAVAQRLRDSVRQQIMARVEKGLGTPGLAVILVGDNPASRVYVNSKKKACEEVGIASFEFTKPSDISEADLLALIKELNNDKRIHGILIQLPLPQHINTALMAEAISPDKDVDGFHPYNMGRLALGKPAFRPCTPKGIIRLLESTGVDITGMDAVVVGRSNIVGRPMALELLAKNCTPRICHSQSRDLPAQIAQADILVAAIGKPGFISGKWIKPGALVMDVGINRLDNDQLTGDVDFESAKKIAGYITPVPGGVGPMTIACLMENTLHAAS